MDSQELARELVERCRYLDVGKTLTFTLNEHIGELTLDFLLNHFSSPGQFRSKVKGNKVTITRNGAKQETDYKIEKIE